MTTETKDKDLQPNVYISGAGVLHVRSSEILKSKEGKRQLEALGKLLAIQKSKEGKQHAEA